MSSVRMNFLSGPAALPRPVLEKARDQLVDTEGTGLSVLEWGHRSPAYAEIDARTEARLRALLGIADDPEWGVLFLQGGASLQFLEVPMNLATPERPGAYVLTGVWSNKALAEAKRVQRGRKQWSGEEEGFTRIPDPSEIGDVGDAAYLHLTSNNTIHGTQWKELPRPAGMPLVVDASSDILSRPFSMEGVGVLYAGAQKNLGPAGITVVVVRRELLDERDDLPAILDYRRHLKVGIYNTPPTFAVWLMGEVLAWLEEEGGPEEMARRSEKKAGLLYDALDASSFYRGVAQADSRSLMNVCWRLPSEELEARFLAESEKEGFVGLKGHRSAGGIRASLYNAIPVTWVEELVRFMGEFEARQG